MAVLWTSVTLGNVNVFLEFFFKVNAGVCVRGVGEDCLKNSFSEAVWPSDVCHPKQEQECLRGPCPLSPWSPPRLSAGGASLEPQPPPPPVAGQPQPAQGSFLQIGWGLPWQQPPAPPGLPQER